MTSANLRELITKIKNFAKATGKALPIGLANTVVGIPVELAEDLPEALVKYLDGTVDELTKATSVAKMGEILCGNMVIAPFLVFEALGNVILDKANKYAEERKKAQSEIPVPALPPEFETALQGAFSPSVQQIIRTSLPLLQSYATLLGKSKFASELKLASDIITYVTNIATAPNPPDPKKLMTYMTKTLAYARDHMTTDPDCKTFYDDFMNATAASTWSPNLQRTVDEELTQQNADFSFERTLSNRDKVTTSYEPDPTDPSGSSKVFKLEKETNDPTTPGARIKYSVALNPTTGTFTTTDKDGNSTIFNFLTSEITQPDGTVRPASPDEITKYTQQADLMNDRFSWIQSHRESRRGGDRESKSLSDNLIQGLSTSFKTVGLER